MLGKSNRSSRICPCRTTAGSLLLPITLRTEFRAAGYGDPGILYTSVPFSHTPTCMRIVHFEASLWIALVGNMSMRPGNNGPLRIRPTQLGTEQQVRLSLHLVSLPRTLLCFAFALWPQRWRPAELP